METRSDLLLYVNGRRIIISKPDPETTLLQYLRDDLGLKGTKVGCAQGGCGSCTVMVSRYDWHTGLVSHRAVMACLTALCSLHGQAITTVEGVGSTNTRLHVVQDVMARSHASQCGFCTPGFVMSAYALLRNSPLPTMEELELALVGNLCRCTGYRPIIDGLRKLTVEGQGKHLEASEHEPNGNDSMKNHSENSTSTTFGKSFEYPAVGNKVSMTEKKSDLNNNEYSNEVNATNRCNVNGFKKGEECITDSATIESTADLNINSLDSASINNSNCLTNSNHNNSENVYPINNNCPMGEKCCMRNGTESTTSAPIKFKPLYDPETQDAIFPSELQQDSKKLNSKCLEFRSKQLIWFTPTSVEDLLQLKSDHSQAHFIAGNTDIGTQRKEAASVSQTLISVSNIRELRECRIAEHGIEIGSATTLTELLAFLHQTVVQLPDRVTKIFKAIADMLPTVGSQQIRNMATIAGHIIAASPVSDLNPLFLAARCRIRTISSDGQKNDVVMDETFYTGYKSTKIPASDLLWSILIPFSEENEFIVGYKQARKKSDDNTSVTSAMRVIYTSDGISVKDVALCFSGMGLTTKEASKTANQLTDMNWDDDLASKACQSLTEELQLASDVAGGKVEFRMTIATSMFFKFYLTMRFMLQEKYPSLYTTHLPSTYRSSIEPQQRPQSESTQLFEQVDDNQAPVDPVGRPIPHLASELHVTGQAVYTDDIPVYSNELHLALVVSTKSHAEIVSIDTAEALHMDGVVDYLDYKDVPGSNFRGHKAKDEQIFRTSTVTCEGQVIGAILADSRRNAKLAARAVKIVYKDLESILSIEEAIKADSYNHIPERKLERGNLDDGITMSDHIIEGVFHVGGQKHFYMETQVCIAVPKGENNEMEIFSSTQSLTTLQSNISRTLNVDCNKIVCRVKRLGGGFGGKETNSLLVALPVVVAAHKHKRPVRCTLDREDDMKMCGGRHPFFAKYKVGFTNAGKLVVLQLELYSDGGYSFDVSRAVMEEALLHIDNCYYIPNVLATGKVCRTNLPSSTAFRGFGAPQAMIITENLMNEIAYALGMSPTTIREINMYEDGEKTPFNQVIENSTIKSCWNKLLQMSDYDNRRKIIEQFNCENRWKKRGISAIPIKSAIGTAMYIDQAGALVHIYTDGSVLISHGGTEMGQGLHTKMVQVASRELKIPISRVFISETSSNMIPNASPTSASATSDLNGMAVLDACQILMARLSPYRDSNPHGTWNDWVKTAYEDKVNLSATGFYKLTELNYSWATNTGKRYNYFTAGAACTEVEIDCLTGEHRILRTDIVMDVGKSLNPAIDIGQIEGAFIQGYGLFVLEDVQYTSDGLIYSKGPNTYRIPTLLDIPIQFNVSLLKDSSNPKAIYSSKGIGEPPLLLSTSVFFAIRDAIESARLEQGLGLQFPFYSPATAEKIRLALLGEMDTLKKLNFEIGRCESDANSVKATFNLAHASLSWII